MYRHKSVVQGQQGEKGKKKSRSFDLLSFWLSLLDLNQLAFGMTNRRVLRHAKASLARSCVILSSVSLYLPLAALDSLPD